MFLFLKVLFLCVYVHCVCMSTHTRVWGSLTLCSRRPEEGVRSMEAEAPGIRRMLSLLRRWWLVLDVNLANLESAERRASAEVGRGHVCGRLI